MDITQPFLALSTAIIRRSWSMPLRIRCFVPNGFSKGESEFSKKNMTLQEKYDEFSKLCSGRVFAGRMPNQ
jgi:hypothetical protein